MAFVRVYNKIGKLRMISVGNALGVNYNPNYGNTTTQSLMISLDPNLRATIPGGGSPGVPSDFGATTYGGTTLDWRQSGSWATLEVSPTLVPVGSTVDSARLVVQTNYGSSPQPTLAQCSVATVTFKTPDGLTYVLSPATTDNSGFNKIANSYDVTTILNGVISSGIDRAIGNYTVSKFPISVQGNIPTQGAGGAGYVGAGWGLVIFYTHPSMPFNSETLYVGDLPNDTTQVITGFYTADAGAVVSRVFVQGSLTSANENDTLRFNTVGAASKFLYGPNNPFNPPYSRNNFLSGIVCDYQGNIQTKGSFGNNNGNALTGSQGAGARTEFTITGLQANGFLNNSSRSASIFSTGDISSIGAFGVEIQVNQAYFNSTKTSNKNIYYPGETITYTIPFTNTGGSTASNVVFTDTLPANLTFLPNTFKVNGATLPGYTLINATLPNVSALATVTVSFNAVVSSTITTTTTIANTGWIGYNFIADPSVPQTRDSNLTSEKVVTVLINSVSATKSVDRAFAKPGDTLTYTVLVKNPDARTYSNVIFQDTTPIGTTFVANSFTLGTITSPANPNTSINVGTLPQLSTLTLTFKVKVGDTVPSPNPIPNSSTLSYTFTDDFGNTTPVGLLSNSVFTQINLATLAAVKTVNPQLAGIGDTLAFTITVANNGNTTATNVVFKDTIPSNTAFVTDSLYVNGAQRLGESPAPPGGITLNDISPGGIATITFNVNITTIPSSNTIKNNSTTTYGFKTDPNGPTDGVGAINSNEATVLVNEATFLNSVIKTSNKAYADINSKILYSITLKNTGNVSANNVIFTDTLPNGTSFVSSSIKVNGTPQSGSVEPPSGFNLGTIPAGQTVTLTFEALVVTIPSPNPIVNSGKIAYTYRANPASPNEKSAEQLTTDRSSVTVSTASFSNITKEVDKAYAGCGETLAYTLNIPNSGNTTALNVIFRDTIPSGTSFVNNSVTLNGITQPGANPATGITLPDIGPGQRVVLTFSVVVQC